MAGIFQGLELAKRALLSHQFSLTTAGHNIANAGTEGFSRQRVELASTDPHIASIGAVGTGVRVAQVRHTRDLFLTTQFRQTNDQLGRWSSMERSLQEVEHIFQEPSDRGFNTTLGEFFAAWQSLSQNPESSAARGAVREQATALAGAFHNLSRRLDDLQRGIDQEVGGRVEDINIVTSEIAKINLQVARYEISGQRANDLRDRRDLLIDQLSKVVDVNVIETPRGEARVFLGTLEIVGIQSSTELATQKLSGGTQVSTSIVWKGSSVAVNARGGEMAGLVESRDELIPAYRSMLDDLASSIVAQVNTLHRTGTGLDGTTGTDFFDPSGVTAATFNLSTVVQGDLNTIAASQSGAVGDNANAIAIANLQDALVLNNNATSFSDFYGQLVSSAGRRSAEAKDAKANAELLVEQVEFSRQSVQGVSLDEEMADLIKAQHAYDAAARVVSTVDHALDTLINGMGVGR